MNIINMLKKWVYSLCPNLWLYRHCKKYVAQLSAEGRDYFATANDIPTGASLDDYLAAVHKHYITLKEYLTIYKYYLLGEQERAEIVTVNESMLLYYRLKFAFPKNYKQDFFINKENFLSFASSNGLIRRKWLFAPNSDSQSIEALLRHYDCIYKPNNLEHGDGIIKIHHDNEQEIQFALRNAIEQCAVIEECIENCDEIKAFHPSSLNTIRVVTLAHEGKAVIATALLRVGAGGHVVDNLGSGGIRANIDIETGVIDSDGMYTDGSRTTHHPDSGLPIKGFHVPQWNDVKQLCLRVAKMVNQSIVVGWDIAITQNGGIEIIEANSLPDSISCKQLMTGKGEKSHVKELVYQVTGQYFII